MKSRSVETLLLNPLPTYLLTYLLTNQELKLLKCERMTTDFFVCFLPQEKAMNDKQTPCS